MPLDGMSLSGDQIRIIRAPMSITLGELRNISMDAAQGEATLQWDDDEAFHPTYISTMIEAHIHNSRVPIFLKRQLGYSFSTDTAFIRVCEGTFIHGANLFPKTDVRYKALRTAEDTEFLRSFQGSRILNNDPILYIHFEHAHNSWNFQHIMKEYASPWALGGWHLCDRHRNYLRSVLERYSLQIGIPQKH